MTMTIAQQAAELLGGERVLKTRVETVGDLRRLVDLGLPKQSLVAVAGFLHDTGKARRAFQDRLVPPASFKRRRERLSPAESERTERAARVAALARAVWGDDGDARAFLQTPHPRLDGRTPLEAAVTDLGAREVEDILRAIEFGLPA